MAISFDTDFDPHHGEVIEVSPLLRRIVCPNESKYTFKGTGTYIVGRGTVAIVDPGPIDDNHTAALLKAVEAESVSHILITHTHGDHSPGAAAVASATGAPVLGFGPHPADAAAEGHDDTANTNDTNDPDATADTHDAGDAADGGDREHSPDAHAADVDFEPDQTLAHGDVVTGPGWTIEALHTPGHISNHLCFALREEQAVLTGDHVMGWSTTIIPPPDGSVGDYLRSLQLMVDRDDTILYPTHGPPVTSPRPFLMSLLQHRLSREAQIIARLAHGPDTAAGIVAVLYADVRPELHRPAAMSVLAHLHKLRDEGRTVTVSDADPLSADSTWILL